MRSFVAACALTVLVLWWLVVSSGRRLKLRQRMMQHLAAGETYSLAMASMLDVSPRAIYGALRTLEAEGLVTSRDGEPLPERGGRPRRYYKLSPRGHYIRALDKWGHS